MSDEKKHDIGFQLSYAAQVDTENQDQLQIHANAPTGASAADLAQVVATMRNAVWLERFACNERILTRAKLIEEKRDERVAEFEANGEEMDEEMIAEERKITNTVIVTMEAKLEADRELVKRILGATAPAPTPSNGTFGVLVSPEEQLHSVNSRD